MLCSSDYIFIPRVCKWMAPGTPDSAHPQVLFSPLVFRILLTDCQCFKVRRFHVTISVLIFKILNLTLLSPYFFTALEWNCGWVVPWDPAPVLLFGWAPTTLSCPASHSWCQSTCVFLPLMCGAILDFKQGVIWTGLNG